MIIIYFFYLSLSLSSMKIKKRTRYAKHHLPSKSPQCKGERGSRKATPRKAHERGLHGS